METVFEILLDALMDSVKSLPFLFGAYLIIEYLEHHTSRRIETILAGSHRLGPAVGAALGCIPQCGFSVAAANLYSGRVITAGTLIAVFLSTSDEAIPVLLASPDMMGVLGRLIVVKVAAAVAVGFAVDLALKRGRDSGSRLLEEKNQTEDMCRHCGCGDSVVLSACRHTAGIFLFLFVVSVILGGITEAVGQEALGRLLLKGSVFQPAIAAVLGFVPNCAASVFLAQMLAEDTISFGAAVAGLMTGAGVGLAVLWKVNHNFRDNLKIMGILYGAAVIIGTALQVTIG